MKKMNDVRRSLWEAYKNCKGFEGKNYEAYCELRYSPIWDCETEEQFSRPFGIMIYSYALGPSRRHYINYGSIEKEKNYYTWESPDIYQKAIDVINSWVKDYEA